MPNTEKLTKTIHKQNCPICHRPTIYAYNMQAPEINGSAIWYRCSCGVIFQENTYLLDMAVYDKKYTEEYMGARNYPDMAIHHARTYIPLVEEMTYGRMLLDVGYNTHFQMNYLRDRGWLCWGIDTNKEAIDDGKFLMKGDFESYDFKEKKFDVIWLSHVLEHFKNPIDALKKCYELTGEDGIVFIATPDISFIHANTTSGFPHWKPKEHYIMWSREALCKEIEKAGFEVVLQRGNFQQRFTSWYDCHIIGQKCYF